MTVVADHGLEGLGADHVAWLLVAADNFLRQRLEDRATVLLELACLLAPDDAQSHRMLAYAYWRQGEDERCAKAMAQALDQPLSEAERAAIKLLERRLETAPSPGGRE